MITNFELYEAMMFANAFNKSKAPLNYKELKDANNILLCVKGYEKLDIILVAGRKYRIIKIDAAHSMEQNGVVIEFNPLKEIGELFLSYDGDGIFRYMEAIFTVDSTMEEYKKRLRRQKFGL